MNDEIQVETHISKQMKSKQENFATLLELLNEPEDVFEHNHYKPESNMQTNDAIQQLESFYKPILDTFQDTSVVDEDYDNDNKFLLYIFSDLPSMDSISVPKKIWKNLQHSLQPSNKNRKTGYQTHL